LTTVTIVDTQADDSMYKVMRWGITMPELDMNALQSCRAPTKILKNVVPFSATLLNLTVSHEHWGHFVPSLALVPGLMASQCS